jgi:hypothetical protein
MRSIPSYSELLDEFFAHLDRPMGIPTKHLRALFFYLEGHEHFRQTEFESYIKHRGMVLKKAVRWSGGVTTGLPGVVWHATPELIAEWQQERARRQQPQKLPLRSVK